MYAKRAFQLKWEETFKVVQLLIANMKTGKISREFKRNIFRDIFELSYKDNRNFVETTKTQVLEGTSKWSAKVAIRGL